MFALTGKSDINTSLRERFAGAGPGEVSLQDARTVKRLKFDDQRRVQEGLTEVEAERQNSAVHQVSYGNEKIALLLWKSLTEQRGFVSQFQTFFIAWFVTSVLGAEDLCSAGH